MASTAILLAAKDQASGQLSADINAATLSIPLQTGDGADYPQPYSGTATSGGASTALNCTGILATIGSGSAGKFIRNITDGSVAFIKSVATNAVTTTPLLGGSDNTWDNSDEWRIDEFVVTFEAITTSAYGVDTVTKREEALIKARSTDTLTVPTGGRGYNSTSAQTFSTNDYVRVLVSAPFHERMKDYLYELAKLGETITGYIGTIRSNADFYAATTGSSNAYAATYSSLSTLSTGLRVYAKANHSNTGAATFNYNSGGAVAIKKLGGSTDVVSGDIPSGMLMELEYDGTYWQLLTPPGQSPVTGAALVKYQNTADSNDITSGTSDTDFDTNYTVNASSTTSQFAAGVSYDVEAWGIIDGGASNRQLQLKLKFGSTTLLAFGAAQPTTSGTYKRWYARCKVTCRTAGASGTVYCEGVLEVFESAGAANAADTVFRRVLSGDDSTVTVDTTANAALKLTQAWNVDDGTKHCKIKDIRYVRTSTT